MATFWEYLWAGSWITWWLWHLNWDATDSSGNGNDWTVVWAVTFPSGKFGLWASWWATTKRITIPRNATLEPQYWTVSLRFNASGDGQQKCFFWVDNTMQLDRYWYLVWMGDTGTLRIEMANASTYIQKDVATGLEDGKWHNIVMTWDANYITGYLDWVQKVQDASLAIAYNWYDLAMLNTVTNTARWWNWTLDEVILENVVWTPVQVQKYYTYSKGRYWNL